MQSTIAELRSEAKRIAQEVTSANLERVEAEDKKKKAFQDIENARLEFSEIKRNCELELKKVSQEQEKLQKKTEEYNEWRSQQTEEYEDFKKIRLKELDRINSWLIAANTEKGELENKLTEMKSKIDGYKEKFEAVLALENKIVELEQKSQLLGLENESLLKQRHRDLKDLNQELGRIQEQIVKLKVEADAAENKRNLMIGELQAKIDDLHTYHSRVKRVWDLVFPGRNMIMLP